MNTTHPQKNEEMAFYEHKINFYIAGIKGYLDIKDLYQKSANISIKAIDKYLIDIQNAKEYGTKWQLQIFRKNLNWHKEQLRFNKRGMKWCNEMMKGNKTELAFYQKSLKELIKENL